MTPCLLSTMRVPGLRRLVGEDLEYLVAHPGLVEEAGGVAETREGEGVEEERQRMCPQGLLWSRATGNLARGVRYFLGRVIEAIHLHNDGR
mmetsp:Transcript_29226/g.40381  ORF Transcript_29226/g.40381 Transcript_29226/m.40381 type:complete len:91 (-) Transcript_29226:41-313(-)